MSTPVQIIESPQIATWLSFEAGRVHVRTGRVELGQGNLTALLQIAADELDVQVGQVVISGGDTRQSPNEGFTSGSLSITQSGTAIRWAASAARHALIGVAARRLAVHHAVRRRGLRRRRRAAPRAPPRDGSPFWPASSPTA